MIMKKSTLIVVGALAFISALAVVVIAFIQGV
jgi:hypothetical protein